MDNLQDTVNTHWLKPPSTFKEGFTSLKTFHYFNVWNQKLPKKIPDHWASAISNVPHGLWNCKSTICVCLIVIYVWTLITGLIIALPNIIKNACLRVCVTVAVFSPFVRYIYLKLYIFLLDDLRGLTKGGGHCFFFAWLTN